MPSRIVLIRSLVGLTQGILLALLYAAGQKMLWPATQPGLFVPILLITLFTPFIWLQGITHLRLKTLGMWTVCVILVLAGLGYYSVFRQQLPLEEASLLLIPQKLISFTIIAFIIAQSLVLSGDQDRRWIANYPTYFDIAWKVMVQLIFAALFVLGLWIILKLGASLFSAIGLLFFKELISHYWFAIPVTTLAISMALHVTDVNVSIVRGIRTLNLILLSWLLPIMASIAAIFLISLCVTGINLLWKTGYAASLLLFATSLLIVLINAVYQDGNRLNNLSRAWRIMTLMACGLLMPLLALAIYALKIRVQQYGWTVNRIEAAACMLILACYAFGYAMAIWSHPWLKRLEICNVLTAYFMLLLYLAVFSPLADPARLAVASQIARLTSGKVTSEQFDFSMLRLQGLRYGQTALVKLQGYAKEGANGGISEQAKKALTLKKDQLMRQPILGLSREQKIHLLQMHTGKLPESFINQDWGLFQGQVDPGDPFIFLPLCLRGSYPVCHAWMVEYKKSSPMIILLSSSSFINIKQNAQGVWYIAGSWSLPYKCAQAYKDAREGRFKMVAPLQDEPDMEFGGWRATFRPNNEMLMKKCQ